MWRTEEAPLSLPKGLVPALAAPIGATLGDGDAGGLPAPETGLKEFELADAIIFC